MDENTDPPVNPYQSPAAGGAPQDTPHPEKVYGLKEPIYAKGRLTAEDVWPTEKPTRRERISTWGWMAVAAVIAVLFARQAMSSPLTPSTLITIFGVPVTIVLIVYLLARYATKRHMQEFERSSSSEKTTISESQIVVEGERGHSVWQP